MAGKVTTADARCGTVRSTRGIVKRRSNMEKLFEPYFEVPVKSCNRSQYGDPKTFRSLTAWCILREQSVMTQDEFNSDSQGIRAS